MRKAWQASLFFLWCCLLFLVFFPPLVAFPAADWRLRMAVSFARWWSRGCLWIAGIRLVVHGLERVKVPAVFTFNHASNLDFFVNAVIAPHGSLVFGKRELARVPLLGWMWLLSGHPLIRRDDRGDWQAKLDLVAGRLRTGRYATIVAPEGKRNHGGPLLPFKKGPFHLAMQGQVPIVPWVLRGAGPLLTRRGMLPGTITVDVLPPISTDDWREETLEEHMAQVRRVYLEALGEQDAAGPPGATPAQPAAAAGAPTSVGASTPARPAPDGPPARPPLGA